MFAPSAQAAGFTASFDPANWILTNTNPDQNLNNFGNGANIPRTTTWSLRDLLNLGHTGRHPSSRSAAPGRRRGRLCLEPSASLPSASASFLRAGSYYHRITREGLAMRTISVRLDDSSEARLDSLCQALGLSQSGVVKAGLELLQRQSASPAALADRLGLIGSFSSGGPDGAITSQGLDHSAQLRRKLGRQHGQQRLADPEA